MIATLAPKTNSLPQQREDSELKTGKQQFHIIIRAKKRLLRANPRAHAGNELAASWMEQTVLVLVNWQIVILHRQAEHRHGRTVDRPVIALPRTIFSLFF